MHDETTPEPERPTQVMYHGEVYGQQPLDLEENSQIRPLCSPEQLASPSVLMVRRQRVQIRNGQMPMPNLTMNTKDACRQRREQDAEDALYNEQIKQRVKQLCKPSTPRKNSGTYGS